MANDEMVFCVLEAKLKNKGPKSFIFQDADGKDVVIPFSQVGTVCCSKRGDMILEEAKNLPTLHDLRDNPDPDISASFVDYIEIPKWLADKLELAVA